MVATTATGLPLCRVACAVLPPRSFARRFPRARLLGRHLLFIPSRGFFISFLNAAAFSDARLYQERIGGERMPGARPYQEGVGGFVLRVVKDTRTLKQCGVSVKPTANALET